MTVLRVAALGALAALASGCVNLVAVRKFAKTSAATADFQEVIGDYASSPLRQRRYEPANHQAELDAIAKRRQAQQPRLEAVQKALVDYLGALGDLAADAVPELDDEVGALGKALDAAKFVGEGDQQVRKETATAAGALASLVGRAVLDGYRQAELEKLLKDADPHLQTAVGGLREVLDKDLRSSLLDEAAALDKPFRGWESAARAAKDDGAPPVARLLLDERREVLQHKQERLDAYLQVLDTIAKGHAELAAHADRLDLEDLQQKLAGYTKDLKATGEAIAALARK